MKRRRRDATVWIDDPWQRPDFTLAPHEKRELYAAIREGLGPDADVGPPTEPLELGGGGPGTTELIFISLGAAASAKTLLEPVVRWMRKRFAKSHAHKLVEIYGPKSGELLVTIKLTSARAKPQVRRPKSERKTRRKKPGRSAG